MVMMMMMMSKKKKKKKKKMVAFRFARRPLSILSTMFSLSTTYLLVKVRGEGYHQITNNEPCIYMT